MKCGEGRGGCKEGDEEEIRREKGYLIELPQFQAEIGGKHSLLSKYCSIRRGVNFSRIIGQR